MTILNKNDSKTDLRVLKTQKALCESFMKLSEKNNFEEISVQKLCDEAMVRRATFYKHFMDKYDFFDFFVRYIQKEMTDECAQALTDRDENISMETFFSFLFLKLADFLQKHNRMVKSLTTSNACASLLEILTMAIQQDICHYLKEQEKKGVRFSSNTDTLSSFLAGGIIQMIWKWYSYDNEMPISQLVEEYKMILHNLLYPVAVTL